MTYTNMKVTKRSAKRVIEPEWLNVLYDEVLLYCENDATDFSGYNLKKNPFLDKLQKDMDFAFVANMKEAKDGQRDTFYFSRSSGKIESWFKHLRNAIAHNRIFRFKDKEGLIIEDENNNQLTMYAEVSSFEKLKNIIQAIKKNYK